MQSDNLTPQPSESSAIIDWIHPLSSLRHRDFQLFCVSQFFSAAVGSMTVPISWHLYELTGSLTAMNALKNLSTVSFILFVLVGGAFTDAIERRRIIMVTQSVLALVSVLLVVTSVARLESPWILYGAKFLVDAVSAFETPARLALLASLIPGKELINAQLLSGFFRIPIGFGGSALAGMLVSRSVPAAAYGLTALASLASIPALRAMQPQSAPEVSSRWEHAIGGLRYVRSERLLLWLLLLAFVIGLFAVPQELMPLFARDIYETGPEGVGALMNAAGLGTLFVSVVFLFVGDVRKAIAIMLVAFLIDGAATLGFAASSALLIGSSILFLSGASFNVGATLRTTILLLRTPDEFRGRVLAISSLLVRAGGGLGRLQTEALITRLGLQATAALSGTATVVAVVLFALLPAIRHNASKRLLELSAPENDTAPTS